MSNDSPNQEDVAKFKKAFQGKASIDSADEGVRLLEVASKGGKHTPNIRKAMMRFQKEQPETLSKLTETEDGRTLLKNAMKGMTKAKTPEERSFVEAAIKTQFSIDVLAGHLTSKALPRLFNVLAQLPEWHVRENDKVVKIKRFKRVDDSDDDSQKRSISWYSPAKEDSKKPAEIVLNLGRVSETEFYYPNAKKTKVNSFDVTTLHEVGHAIDDKVGYMKSRKGGDTYGGWRDEIPFRDIVRDVIVKKFGFFDDFPGVPRSALLDYLADVAATGTIGKPSTWDALTSVAKSQELQTLLTDPGLLYADDLRRQYAEVGRPDESQVSQDELVAFSRATVNKGFVAGPIIDLIVEDGLPLADAAQTFKGDGNEQALDFDKVAEHDAVKWLSKVGLKSDDTGLWDGGDKAATSAQVDGVVYQLSYRKPKTNWVSYRATARADKVSDYQFRAPGEWFAEVYALYFLGELPKSHPATEWLQRDFDTNEKPNL